MPLLRASVAAPLAGGRGVLVSSWRDIHEGALADVVTLPGICRIDVLPRRDTLSIRPRILCEGELQPLPASDVDDVALRAEDWDGPRLQAAGHHTAFRVRTAARTLDVSVLLSLCRLLDHGIVRVSAQATLTQADA